MSNNTGVWIDAQFFTEVSEFEKIGLAMGRLVTEKNRAYGDSFGPKSAAFLQLLWPNGIPVESYEDAQAIMRVFDKLCRIATDKDAFGESPWRDITGYGILGVAYDNARDSKS